MRTITGFYNGIMYQIQYAKELSHPSNYSDRVTTYKVFTDEDKFGTCFSAIVAILTDENVYCGISAAKHSTAKDMATALSTYHKMEWSDEHNCLLFKIITPYND